MVSCYGKFVREKYQKGKKLLKNCLFFLPFQSFFFFIAKHADIFFLNFYRGRLRDIRVPEECPEEVRALVLECLETRPSMRPSALRIVERLQAVPKLSGPTAVAAGAVQVDSEERSSSLETEERSPAQPEGSSGDAATGVNWNVPAQVPPKGGTNEGDDAAAAIKVVVPS